MWTRPLGSVSAGLYRLFSPCGDPLGGAFRGCVVVATKSFLNLIVHFYGIFRHLRPVFVLFKWKRRRAFDRNSVLNAMFKCVYNRKPIPLG